MPPLLFAILISFSPARLARSFRPVLLPLLLATAGAAAASLVVAPGVAHAEDGGKAQRAFKAAEYETALREYRALVKDREKADPDILAQIARCLDRLLRSNDAIVAYQHLLHSGASSSQAKEARERIAFLREFLARGATREQLASNHIERGAALFKLELYREARTEFEGAVRALPEKPNGYRWMGLTLERLGDCKQAISDFETFRSIVASDDPRNDEVNAGIKRCSARLGGAGGSATAGARPVGDEPLAPRASDREKKVKEHVDRGSDLFAAGRFKEAREEFAIARTLAPEKATPFRWLGLVDALLDRCGEAVQNLEVFLKRVPANDPRVPEVQEVIASCRDKQAAGSSSGSSGSRAGGESGSAASSAKPSAAAKAPAPSNDPESRARVLIEKGTGLYHGGSYREARDAFEEARALLPDRANAYRWLGLADARLGRCKEAIASFDIFIARVSADDDRITEVARVRGRCARELGGSGGGAVASSSPSRVETPRANPDPPRAVDPDAPRSSPSPRVASVEPSRAEPAPERPPADSPPPAASKPSSVPSYTVPLVVGVGAVAVAGIGAGVLAWGYSEFNTLNANCAPNCLKADADAVRNKLVGGGVVLGLGALMAVGDVVLWYFWSRDRGREAPRASVAPNGGGASLVVSGTF